MQRLRHYINPKQFVITTKQIAKLLGIDPRRIIKWKPWYNVLWVHIEGKGGYFISYRRLKQWLAACSTLIHFCPTVSALKQLWECIENESERYSQTAFYQLTAMVKQRYHKLSKLYKY